MTELATAILFGLVAAFVQPLFAAVLVAPFLGLMLAISIIDARWRIVPNRIIYPALLLFAAAILIGDLAGAEVDAPRAGLGLLVYGLPLFAIALAVPHGMGMGDVKLVALIGLVLGSLGLAHVAVAAGVGILFGGLGAITGVILLRYGRKQEMPFGPFLAGGGVVAALAGPSIASAYLSLVT